MPGRQGYASRPSDDWPFSCDGGDGGDRTPDLLIANQTLSQLSYAPINLRSAAVYPICAEMLYIAVAAVSATRAFRHQYGLSGCPWNSPGPTLKIGNADGSDQNDRCSACMRPQPTAASFYINLLISRPSPPFFSGRLAGLRTLGLPVCPLAASAVRSSMGLGNGSVQTRSGQRARTDATGCQAADSACLTGARKLPSCGAQSAVLSPGAQAGCLAT